MPKKSRSKKPASKKKAAKKVKKLKKTAKKPMKRAVKKMAKKSKKVKNVKKAKVKVAKKKITLAKKTAVQKIAEKVIGKVTHYYDRIGVAVVAVESPIKVGDTVRLKHGETEFDQKVESLQVNHAPIAMAAEGQEVGMKVDQLATEGTLLLKP